MCAIRTMVIRMEKYICEAGAGIVVDSDPEKKMRKEKTKLKPYLRL